MLRAIHKPLLTALLFAALAPATASAATGSGAVTLTLPGDGPAAAALRADGGKVRAVAPAKRNGKRLKLPVSTVAVGSSATVVLRGGARFTAGKRSVRLRALRLSVGPRQAKLTAKVGKRRFAFLAATLAPGKAKLDRNADSARLSGAGLRLTRAGAALLRSGLDLDGLRAGKLGKLGVDARRKGAGGGGGNGGGNGPGGGGPQSGPIVEEPVALARPGTAVDVTDLSISWYPRDSWVRYITSATGPQDGRFATDGATKAAPMVTSGHPCSDVPYPGSGTFDYRYDFTPKGGWYDPVTGDAALYGQGKVRFRWVDHTIDMVAADPEIEIDGADSRAIFRFSGSDGTAFDDQRAELLDLGAAGALTDAGGGSFTYTDRRGLLTADGESVFAGFYPEGDGFGCVSASFTTTP
jgi:hypothetical protein